MAIVGDDGSTRSSFCSANSCIKVTRLTTGEVVIGGGTPYAIPVSDGITDFFGQVFSAEEWAAFFAGVKAGDFDHIAG
jgi:hypothetical protein